MPHPFAHAEEAAARSLKRIGLDDPSDVPLDALAGAFEIGLRSRLIEGAQGRLVRGSAGSIVVISTSVALPTSRRFVFAHELGHHQLPWTQSQLEVCSADNFLPSYREPHGAEAQASAFARAFLMPKMLARPICTGRPGFETIRALHERFQVSLTAAALRFLQLTDERCAVVFSKRGSIRWFSTSEDFGHGIPFNTPLDPQSYAYDAARGKAVPGEPEALSATAWLGGKRIDDEDDIYEESVPMPSFNAVLTLLWIPSSARY